MEKKYKVTKNNLSPELQTFLKKKRLLTKFLHNCDSVSRITFNKITIINCVCQGFTWSASPEGQDFWSKLDVEYEKLERARNEI